MSQVMLGRYRLVERVAQGGMGEVYRAVDAGFGGAERLVAIKRIAPELGDEPEFARTFANEAKLSFLLSHANVARVLDVGEEAGTIYIVLEWIHGADLGSIMATLRRDSGQATVPLRLALAIVAEVARGLDYTHRVCGADGVPLGLVHRDVSPSNILLSVEGEVKITDFGIARSRIRPSASLPGQLKGKLFYMAPEQARAERVDVRADVFALGAVLYEMLSGSNPFTLDGADADLLERVRQGRYPRLRSHAPSVPANLAAIVEHAMAVQREDRFGTCRELREALGDYALHHGYGLSVDELGDFVRTLATTGWATIPTAAPTLPGRKWRPSPDGEPHDTLEDLRTPDGAVVDELALVSTAPHKRPKLALVPRPIAPLPTPTPTRTSTPTPSTGRGPRLAIVTLVVICILGALGAKWLRFGATPTPIVPAAGDWVVPDLAPPPPAR